MNKKEILGLCEFLKLHGYENTDNISKFIFGLQQENKKINIYNGNINSFVEKQKVNKIVINFVFWVTYLIFLAIGIYCFVYNENNWLED